MGISLISNVAGLAIRPHLERAAQEYARATERLASGKRVLHPSDDAAGLARASLAQSQLRSTETAVRNVDQARSLVQVAEGGMEEASHIVTRMRELSIQACSNYVTDSERGLLTVELNQLTQELDRLSESVRFGQQTLLNGQGAQYTFQVGTENTPNDRIAFDASVFDLRSSALGVSSLSFGDVDASGAALGSVDTALQSIQLGRATLGAIQSRLDPVENQLKSQQESQTLLVSSILDADVVQEALNQSSAAIVQQSSIAMFAQANRLPELALRLIQLIN